MKRIFIILFALTFCEAYAQNSHYSSDLIHSDYNLVKDTLKKKYIIAEYGLVFPKLNILEDGQTVSSFEDLASTFSSKISIGYGKSIGRIGFYSAISNNRYNILTRYKDLGDYIYADYELEYLSLDLGLSLDLIDTRLINLTFKGGLSYNNLLSG